MMPSGLPSCQDWNFINIKTNSFLEVISFLKSFSISQRQLQLFHLTVRFGPRGTGTANGGT